MSIGRKRAKKVFSPMKDAMDGDIIIPIMGPTGAGKSTFINYAAGEDASIVGHNYESCTRKIQTVEVLYRDRRVIFVDTPGFSDTSFDDLQILEHIAKWLSSSYKKGKKLAGIIYLHDMTLTRMYPQLQKNFTVFGKLCGDDALKNVILATTKWKHVPSDEIGKLREASLRDTYWKEMMKHGSHMVRFDDSPKSAWEIVERILGKEHIYALLIQEELVDLQKRVPETNAGIAVRRALEESIQTLKERMTREQTGDPLQGLQEQTDAIYNQLLRLKVPLTRRIATFFFSHKRSRSRPV